MPEQTYDQVETTEREISLDEAAADTPPESQQASKQESVLEQIIPKAAPRQWELGPEGMRRTYIQKPMSFIARMQWFALVGEVLDKALSGPNAMSLNSLFSAPTRDGSMSVEDFRDADTFVQAIAKLMSVAPEFLVDSYCIWLNVPDYERGLMADIMKLPPDEGGLSDDQGFEIIEIFIDQNYDAIHSFFTERLQGLRKRAQAAQERARA